MKNERIWKWFSTSHVCEALLGRGDYFIADVTFREEHDLTLILGQLYLWAKETGQEMDAARGLEAALREYASEGAIQDALQLMWSYFVIADERHEQLPINSVCIQTQLAMLIKKEAHRLSTDEPLRRLALLVAERLPHLAEALGLAPNHRQHEPVVRLPCPDPRKRDVP